MTASVFILAMRTALDLSLALVYAVEGRWYLALLFAGLLMADGATVLIDLGGKA
jgi:hypothetical protein